MHSTHEISFQWIRFDFVLSELILDSSMLFHSNSTATDACDHAVTISNGHVFRHCQPIPFKNCDYVVQAVITYQLFD